jgi:glucose/arabinose dehydrogenase
MNGTFLTRSAAHCRALALESSRVGALRSFVLTILLQFFPASNQAAQTATLPAGFTEEQIPGPWNEPVGLTFEPDQPTSGGPAYVWERAGRVWILENGVKQNRPLIDISEEVGGWRDHGLLGFALHPNFRQNGYIFLAYTVDHHHLTKFGTTNYHSSSNEYLMATIHRITRYTARASDGFRTVDLASRKILLGESITNGFPSVYQSHGICSLVFGTDETLLAAGGDGASYSSIDTGSATETYFTQAMAEGIIQPKENVGAFRAQMLSSLSGKIVRLDPETGDGVEGNPFFDPAHPRSAQSRIWALGLRNPFRFCLRPGTGSHRRGDADPGVLCIGDVGLQTFEDLNVAAGPGLNFGWPLYEGLETHPTFRTNNAANQDAPNPLFGSGGCTQQYFHFRDLIVQDTLNPPSWPNPCNTNQQIPTNIVRFVHQRPAIDWKHETGPARTGIYSTNGTALVTNIGGAGSPISGPQFGGTSSIGGTWYQGDDFPSHYKNTYFHGDYEGQWIRNFVFDTNNNPVAVREFLSGGGGVVSIATHPIDGGLYYVTWTNGIKRIRYGANANQPPKAVARADKYFGPSPLTVEFTADGSTDPEGFPVTYRWTFGDGSPATTQSNVTHTFNAPTGVPTPHVVTVTVTDRSNATAQSSLLISVNNTPPAVTIVSPTNGTRYSVFTETTYPLSALISDVEHTADQLHCEWQTVLHHNNHIHSDPPDTNCLSSLTVSTLGCDGAIYYYTITLKVTDDAGLSTTREVRLDPDCPPLAPVLTFVNRDAFGVIRWQLRGDSAQTYQVEGSTNLTDWVPVTAIVPVGGTNQFNDPTGSNLGFRFYRAVLTP